MRALPGDHIILAPPSVDGPLREGEVIETRGQEGQPPYVVRWSDGHEGLLYPGPGSVLRVESAHGSHTALEPVAGGEAAASVAPHPEHAPSGMHLHARDWTVRISVLGDEDDAEARVVLVADSPRHLTAHGHSHRSSGDRPVPEIGDEVAVARALRRLADRLLGTAADDIQGVTGEHDVTLRSR
ncbi:hypothetical protein GCM10022415_29120 [Knoellia locipacati]|uniref:DUF1918 domain-containing protein n=1 Tax=Knoellia locipacati TaxID=882824 RepID=A0A512T500_9MICO|nr:dsRBD fold-containing protein [Knoellia locipacati]GEQ15151.1 hypothetical protein KLO01_31980 [Knoellia locipacati]